MTEIISSVSNLMNNGIQEKLVEACDADIVIMEEPKSEEVIKEIFLESMNLFSNTSPAKSLITNNINLSHANSDVCSMDVMDEEENSEKLHANLTQFLTSSTSPNKQSTFIQYPEETLESLLLMTTKNALLTEMALNKDKHISELIRESNRSSRSILEGENVDDTNNYISSNKVISKPEGMNTNCVLNMNSEADREYSVIPPPLNDASFSCRMCSFTTNKPKTLRCHERSHKRESILKSMESKSINTKKLKCKKCGFSASRSLLLKRHMKKHSQKNPNEPKFSCPDCSYVTEHQTNLKRHQTSHRKGSNISCTWCDFKSTPVATMLHKYKCKVRLSKLSKHLKENFAKGVTSTVENKSISLHNVPKKYPEFRSQESEKITVKCSICPFSASSNFLLKKHIRKHLVQVQEHRVLSCPQCSYVTDHPPNMKRHENTHKRCRTLSCTGCDFKSTPMSLIFHQYTCKAYLSKQVKGLKEPSLSPIIDNENPSSSIIKSEDFTIEPNNYEHFLADQQTSSSNPLELKPEVDDEEFLLDEDFNVSEAYCFNSLKSRQDIVFKCAECPFYATRSLLLRKHLMTHLPEVEKTKNYPNFNCPECSYAAVSAGNLERHRKSHENFQSLPCPGCDFISTPKSLKFHQSKCEAYLLIHPKVEKKPLENATDVIDVKKLGDTNGITYSKTAVLKKKGSNFSCPECSYVAASITNLGRHQKSHTKYQTFSCAGCDFKSTPKSLKFHQYKCEAYSLKQSQDLKVTIKTESVGGVEVSDKLEVQKNAHSSSFKCPDCSYVTICTGNLERHRKSHNRYEIFSCMGCGYKSTPKSLKFHQYKCKKYLLKYSENLTDNPSQYTTTFDDKGLLYKNGSKFSCPECSYTTVCTANLIRHQKSHRRFQNVSCPGCGFKSTPKSVMFHQYTCEDYLLKQPISDLDEDPSEQKKVFKCLECAFSSDLRIQLKRHVKKQHELTKDPLSEQHTETESTVDDPRDSPDHTISSNFNCSLCLFSTTLYTEFDIHWQEHNEVGAIKEKE